MGEERSGKENSVRDIFVGAGNEELNNGGRRALKIAGIYFFCGFLWIILSDRLLAALIQDRDTLTQFQTYKGWVFILFTAVLILVLSRRALLKTERLAANIQESEGRFRALFENVSVAALVIDPSDGSILDANEAAAAFYGWPREQLRSMRITQINTLTSEELRPWMDEAARKKQGFFNFRHRRADGSIRDVEVYSGPIQFKERTALCSIIHDVTERKLAKEALRESEEKFRALVETSCDWIWAVDENGVYTYASPRVKDILGYAAEEVVGKTPFDFMPQKEREHIAGKFGRIVANREPLVALENINLHRDGRAVILETSGMPIFDLAGSFKGYRGIDRDITERKRSEDALKQSEAKYRRLYNETPVLLHSIDRNGIVVEVNDHWLKTLGYERSEVIGRKLTDFYTEASRKYALEVIQPAFFLDGTVKDVSCQFVKKNGDVVDVLLSATGERDAAGTVVRSQAVIVDITERKRTEDLLRQSEARYRMLYEGTPVMMHSIDAEGRLLSVSGQWLRTLGYTRDEVLGRRSTEFLDEQSRTYARTVVLPDFMRTGICTDVPYTFIKKNGESVSTLLSAIAERDDAGTFVRSLAVIIDITERKRAEEKLRESEARFRRLVEQSPIAISIIDRSGRIEYTNKKHVEIVGYTAEEIPTLETWWASAYPDAEARQRAMTAWGEISRRIFSGEDVDPIERTIACKDGSSKEVEMRFSLAGEMILAVFVDITERKRVENALRSSEERFKAITTTASDAILLMDDKGKILYWNPAAERIFKYQAEEVIGKDLHILLAPQRLHEKYLSGFARFAMTGEGPVINRSVEMIAVKKNGEEFPMEVSTSAMNINGKWHALGIVRDITDRRLLEEERLKTQKLESVGMLAGGIAHDFNNLLQGIFGYISMARMTIDRKEKSLAMLKQAEKALHHSVNLTTQLLTFSKGGKPVKQTIAIAPVIENAARFALSGSRIDYSIDIRGRLLAVEADAGQIAQVIQNIVLNADQAMPMGGTVRITAENAHAPGSKVPTRLKEGDYVMISIQDSGVGIPEQYLTRIFDPYFTTKEKGSGLGLATSYSIIRNHDGMIDVWSQIGKGSTFTIYLPATGAALEPVPVPPTVSRPSRRKKVLVMDDEEVVRMVAGELLDQLGHEAGFATDGGAALVMYRAAKESGRSFDVVILDLTIRGGMGGVETVRKLSEIDPDVKAVVSSGYSDDDAVSEYQKYGFMAFLKKPYDLEELRTILDPLLK